MVEHWYVDLMRLLGDPSSDDRVKGIKVYAHTERHALS